MNYMWETFKMAFYLILVISFILAIYYLVKKHFSFNSTKEMELIDSMSLLNGETIYLIKVYDDIVMVGGGKEELNYLKSWPISEIDFDLESLEAKDSKKIDFKSKLRNVINTKNKVKKDKKQNNGNDSDQNE